MHNVSVTAQVTTIKINSQTTRTFTNYTKTLVQFHRWNSAPPQYIYLDLHGNAAGGSGVLAHMIVYGIQGYVANVDPKIYDSLYAFENNRMVMQTNLDLNGNRLMNH